MCILGIDLGSRKCGYVIIFYVFNKFFLIMVGFINIIMICL